jgi:hypothetical protein
MRVAKFLVRTSIPVIYPVADYFGIGHNARRELRLEAGATQLDRDKARYVAARFLIAG